MLKLIIKIGEKGLYGFGFGLGMGVSFKLMPIKREHFKTNAAIEK